MTGKDWMKAFISKLLNISHGQWMYRNFSLHNKTRGHLQLTRQAEALAEIATLAECRPEDVPPESRFLLEVEITQLDSKSLVHQEYWIAAMRAALKAGRRSRTRSPSQRVRTQSGSRQRRNLYRFSRRVRLLERQLREDLDLLVGASRDKRKRSDADSGDNPSNKRWRKPD